MAIMTATKEQYQAAINKAHKLGMVAKVRPVGKGLYSVPSNTDPSVVYSVAATRRGEFLCNCIAAGRGIPCCHSAAVWVRVMSERSMKSATQTKLSAREELFGVGSHR